MRPRVIKLDHVYECPPLYDVLYNKNRSWKLGEATAFAAILEQAPKRPKSILELFSGANSYHRQFFEEAYNYADEIEVYKGLDAFAEPSKNVLAVDPLADYGEQFDAILAYYYTASSVVDPDSKQGLITREYYEKLYANIYEHLNVGGVFVLDSAKDGWRVAMGCAIDRHSTNHFERVLHPGHSLRLWMAEHGIKPRHKTSKVELRWSYKCSYDRMTANNIDVFRTCGLYLDDVLAVDFKIAKPFCQRYFAESEVVDLLKGAGFKKIDFWSCDYPEHDFNLLSWQMNHSTLESLSEDVIEQAMTNVFVARK